MPIPEGEEPFWCQWCGGDIGWERLHLATCSNSCRASLSEDIRKRSREAWEASKPVKRRKLKEVITE